MPATFRKTIEVSADVPIEDPTLASFTMHVRKRPESPHVFVTVEVPGPTGPTLGPEQALSDLVGKDAESAVLATLVDAQTGALQASEFTTDSADVKPLPVKVPVEPAEQLEG